MKGFEAVVGLRPVESRERVVRLHPKPRSREIALLEFNFGRIAPPRVDVADAEGVVSIRGSTVSGLDSLRERAYSLLQPRVKPGYLDPVVQMDRTPPCGGGGRRFEFCRGHAWRGYSVGEHPAPPRAKALKLKWFKRPTEDRET